MFNKIMNRINSLNLDSNDDAFEISNALKDQLHRASSSFYTKEELTDIIFSDDDVLDTQEIIEFESEKWLVIRDIQHDIVNFFGDLDQSA